MTEARVLRLALDESKAAAEAAGVPDYMAGLSIFRVLLNHPALAKAVHDLLATMLWHGALEPRLRELMIMRIGVADRLRLRVDAALARRSRFGRVGRRPARRAGLDRHAAFGGAERAVLAATDEVLQEGAVSAETWAVCSRELGTDPAVLVELVTAIATWRMIATLLHSLEIPLEDGVSSWPPEGQPPSR